MDEIHKFMSAIVEKCLKTDGQNRENAIEEEECAYFRKGKCLKENEVELGEYMKVEV